MQDRTVTVSVEMPASAVDQTRYFCHLVAQFPKDVKACVRQIGAIMTSEEATPSNAENLAQIVELLEQRCEETAQLIICLHSVFKHAVISDPEGRKGETLQ